MGAYKNVESPCCIPEIEYHIVNQPQFGKRKDKGKSVKVKLKTINQNQ